MPDTPTNSRPDLFHYKKLNLGCGWDIREGFLNVDLHDFHKPDYVADILDLPELPSRHYDVIVAQDVLEHIERAKQIPALKEWTRLLSAHGRLKIRLPSLFDMLRTGTGSGWFSAQAHAHLVNMVYGTQAYNGDYHLAGHTALTLVDAGKQVGLVISHAAIKDGWLFDIEFARNTEELSKEHPQDLFRRARPPGRSVWLQYGPERFRSSKPRRPCRDHPRLCRMEVPSRIAVKRSGLKARFVNFGQADRNDAQTECAKIARNPGILWGVGVRYGKFQIQRAGALRQFKAFDLA